MGHTTNYLKAAFIILSIAILELAGENTHHLRAWQLVRFSLLIAVFILAMLLIFDRSKIKIHIVAFLFFLPLMFSLLAWRLGSQDPTTPMPSMLGKLNPQKPDYNNSYLATVWIQKKTGPGTYHTKVRLDAKQSKPIYRKRLYKNKKDYKKTKIFYRKTKTKSYRKKNYTPKIKSAYRKRNFRKSRYKRKVIYKKRTWNKAIPYPTGSAENRPFGALIRIYNGPDLYPGCIVQMRIFGRAVPGKIGPSFQKYLRSQHLVTSWSASGKYHIIEHRCYKKSIRQLFRAHIEKTLHKYMHSNDYINVLHALVLGKSAYLDKKQKRRIAQSGILHLFAASGLHLGIFYLCFLIPLSALFGKKSWITIGISLMASMCFVYLLDFPLSLVRAFIFLGMHSIFLLTYKKLAKTTLILNTLLLILFFAPRQFTNPGNLLSFGAVGGIFLFYSYLNNAFAIENKILQFIWAQISLSLSASALTTPIVVYFFGGYPFMSLANNIILVPIMGLLIPIVYAALAMGVVLDFCVIIQYMFMGIEWGLDLIFMILAEDPIYVENFSSLCNPMSYSLAFSICMMLLLYIDSKCKYKKFMPNHIDKTLNQTYVKMILLKIKKPLSILAWINIIMLSPVGYLVYDPTLIVGFWHWCSYG